MGSFALKRDEDLAAGMTRVAGRRAEKALERLRGIESGASGKADAIHGARRDLKKLRAVLRLLRAELPKKVYQGERERYREAARKLSVSRDAEVKLQTLARLGEQSEGLPEEAVESWKQILEGDRKLAVNTDEAELEEAAALIEAGRAGIEAWQLSGNEWETIEGSLTRIYRRGRRAMRAARKDPSEENLHQWRKRAKDLRYALELLGKAWKGPLEATAEEAHRLSDLLGDHHDLAVLREDLHERRLGEEETRRLEAALAAEQDRLAADAFGLGPRLYAERPKEFSRRLGRYWQAWRG